MTNPQPIVNLPLPQRAQRRAFSLSELVVAVGILILMLSLAGQVFNITVQSTGQATALVELGQELRAFEKALRDDLRNVQPGQSMMLIQCNPVNAYWSVDGQASDDDRQTAGGGPLTDYPRVSDPDRERTNPGGPSLKPLPALPRADVLMFFTGRKTNSYVHPDYSGNVQQVVYGHAELGQYTPNAEPGGTPFVFVGDTQGAAGARPYFPQSSNGEASLTDVAEVPASRWHLARRPVLLVPGQAPLLNLADVGPPPTGFNLAVTRLDDPRILECATDVVGDYAIGATNIPLSVDELVLAPPLPLDVSNELQGETSAALARFEAWQLPRIFLKGAKPDARSRLDPTPPAQFASRLGHYMLPGCASFKVEWALNPRSDFVAGRLDGVTEVVWFDPGYVEDPASPDLTKDDPLKPLEVLIDRYEKLADPSSLDIARNLKSLVNDRTTHADGRVYSLSERFRTEQVEPEAFPALGPGGRTNVVAFVGNRRHLQDANALVPDDVFPGALRVTIDVFDSHGRLQRPVRHVMIIPIGG